MVKEKAHSAAVWNMRGVKPIAMGYKNISLCAFGYLLSFRFADAAHGVENPLYIGVKTLESDISLDRTSQAVVDLCLDLLYKAYSFILFCDNYFSKIRLFKVLRDIGIAACGTTRANWPEYPP